MPSTREIKVTYIFNLYVYKQNMTSICTRETYSLCVQSVSGWLLKDKDFKSHLLHGYPAILSYENVHGKKHVQTNVFEGHPKAQLINFADQMALPRNELRKRSIRMTTKASQTGLHRCLHNKNWTLQGLIKEPFKRIQDSNSIPTYFKSKLRNWISA